MIEVIETYWRHGTGDFSATVTGGKAVVEILHQKAKFVPSETRNPKPGCPLYLVRSKTKAYTIPEQYRVVIRDAAGCIEWEDRRRFLDYNKAVKAAVSKARRGL